ncbi:aaa family protein [Cystoisospora suis]|uniref:Aaa family protein n=1 Tax=Cystoisospora suis TaxID=483139 RepID=A0A2C6LBE6_9APIC|nr:aaa family protein [Cystoisospora suis]
MHTSSSFSSFSSSFLVGSTKRRDKKEPFFVPGMPVMNGRMDRCQQGTDTPSMKARGAAATATPPKIEVAKSSSLRSLQPAHHRRKSFSLFSTFVILFILTTLCSFSVASDNEPPSGPPSRPPSSGKGGRGEDDDKGPSSPDAKDNSERKKGKMGAGEQGEQGNGGTNDGEKKLVAPPPLGRLKPTATRENFTDLASDVLDCTEQLAWMLQHAEISTVHLIACLLDMPGDPTIPKAIDEAGGNAAEFRKEMHNVLIRIPPSMTPLSYGEAHPMPGLRRTVVEAFHDSQKQSLSLVGINNLVNALAATDRFRTRLAGTGADTDRFAALVNEAYMSQNRPGGVLTPDGGGRPGSGNTEWMKAFGVNLTEQARSGRFSTITGRDEEIEQITSVLSRMNKANCLLLGEPGVGKTAVVEALAQRVVDGNVTDPLLGVTIFSLDVASLLSGSSMRGEFERRMKTIIEHLLSSQRSIVLFIDEIHTLMGAGKADGPMDAANLLKPALARGDLRVIGATTRMEYRKYIEKDQAFARRFIVVEMKEPTVDRTITMLRGLRSKLEGHHRISISDEALVAAATLSHRYIKSRQLPDKAIDLIDDACAIKEVKRLKKRHLLDVPTEDGSEVTGESGNKTGKNEDDKKDTTSVHRVASETQLRRKKSDELGVLNTELEKKASSDETNVLTVNDVADVISLRTGIPVSKLTESEKQTLLRLPAALHDQVIGQDEAVEAVANAIIRSRAGLSSKNAPIGVGKTELAKALTLAIFHDEKNLIRLDMSEFSEPHTVARLVGSPPGYVSHDEGGQLTEAVRQRPHSVVLFDEIENAHPNVFGYFLQLLDEGRLTDSRGVTVDFTNCVIIATSNIGASQILQASEKAADGKMTIGHFDKEKERLEHLADASAGAAMAEDSDDKKKEGGSTALSRKKKSNWKIQARSAVMAEAAKVFKPQVLNRMNIIIFDPLTPQDLKQIVGIQARGLAKLLGEQKIELIIDDGAARFIVERAYSRNFGARRLKRFFDKNITGRLAPWMLTGWLRPNMRLRIASSRTKKNSLEAHVCEVDGDGRCNRATRRARILCTAKVPDQTKDAEDPM